MAVKGAEQKLLLEYLISSPDTFVLCQPIMKSKYFNPEYRKCVEFINEYYDKYHAIPSTVQISANTDVELDYQIITTDKLKYCMDKIESFCKRKAIEFAVTESSGLIDTEDYGRIENIIKDAVSVSLHRDAGSDYFVDIRTRLERLSSQPQRLSTGWKDIDTLLGGGLARTELMLFSANSGGGKSITLGNLAVNYLVQGLNVLYVSLELSKDMVEQRFDTMFTGIPTIQWEQHKEYIIEIVEEIGQSLAGKLVVERLPSGSNANAVRSVIREYELAYGFAPDVLIIDYLDIMGPNEKMSADNISEKDKRTTEQLRDILFDYNMIGATASQQNRQAISATELTQEHIAGGLTKVNTVDWYISIILTPAMKAAGDIMFMFLKSRSSDAVGKSVLLSWDNTSLRIKNTNKTQQGDQLIDNVRERKTKQEQKPKKTLKDVVEM